MDFREGEVEYLPFPDTSFDVVLSSVGVMFAPNQGNVADELLRVLKSGVLKTQTLANYGSPCASPTARERSSSSGHPQIIRLPFRVRLRTLGLGGDRYI